jgi:hypothetical protein
MARATSDNTQGGRAEADSLGLALVSRNVAESRGAPWGWEAVLEVQVWGVDEDVCLFIHERCLRVLVS